MAKHHVKTHSWVNGMLKTVDQYFGSLEEAIAAATSQLAFHLGNSDGHQVKVYNDRGELVHNLSSLPAPTNTYA